MIAFIKRKYHQKEKKMKKFIPNEKLSKKKRRELAAKQRVVWALKPTTRIKANEKIYNRKKARNWNDDASNTAPFVCLCGFTNNPLSDEKQKIRS